MNCLSNFKQLNIFEQFTELSNFRKKQPTGFLNLLQSSFDINSFTPKSFTDRYYSTLGKNREHSLSSILSALLLMHIFRIPTTTLLTYFLIFSDTIREFCGFHKGVPDESFFSRFKTSFESDIKDLFDQISLHVIDLCDKINETLPTDHPFKDKHKNLIYDTSGLKPRVRENNPKFLVGEINRQKVFAKTQNLENYNPYAAAYKNMPKQASCNSSIKLDFANGHFGYFYKFGIITNGFGIPLNINFFDEAFYQNNTSDFDTPEDQKYFYDNASLKSVLSPFLSHIYQNSNFKFSKFLGDSEFDSYDNFGFLKSCGFEKVFIPINSRNAATSSKNKLEFNSEGIPLCPLDKKEFKPGGSCGGKNRSRRFKFVCPKATRGKDRKWSHTCDNPCTDSKSGRMTYVYSDKDFRLYPGVQRNSEEWTDEYHGRTCIERELAYMKSNPSIATPLTTNTSTMRADLYLAAISRQLNIVIAYALNNPQFIKSINPILKLAA